MQPTESQPIVSPKVSPAKSPAPKAWTAGTLTYTTGGLALLFFWLLWGDFAWSLKDRSVGPAMQIILKKYEAVDWVVGLLLGALPPAIAMIFCPIVSYHSDRHRGRWGRRIPFLLIPAPIISLGMVGIAFSPMLGTRVHEFLGAHSPGLNPCILVSLAFFWTLFDFANVAANGLFVALINDVVPTAVIGRFFGAFRVLSLVAGIAFNYWLFGKVETYFLPIFIGIAVIFGFGIMLMCFTVKEGEYPPPPPPGPQKGIRSFFAASAGYFRECFGKPFYLLAFLVIAVPSIVFVPVNLFSIFFAKSIGLEFDTLGKWTAAVFFVSMIMSYPLGILADKFHPLRVGLVTLGLYAAVVLWGGFFINDATTYTIAYFLSNVLGGTWSTAAASLPQRLFPKEKFAEYNSATGIINCIAQIVIGPLLGVFLDFSGHIYRYSYLVSFVFACICIGAGLVLYRKMETYGGPKGYTAP